MQYVEKHLNPLLDKVDTVTTALEEINSTAKTITEKAKQTVDETSTQWHKDKETGGGATGVTYTEALKGKSHYHTWTT